MSVGPHVEAADCGVADPPFGRVEHPLHAHLVGGIRHDLQVRERVFHLTPVVETDAADHLVGKAGTHEVLLDHPALRVGPVEDRHVAPAEALVIVELRHRVRHPLGFIALIVGVVADDLVAFARVGP